MLWWSKKKRPQRDETEGGEDSDRRQFPRIKKDLMLCITPIDHPQAMGLTVDLSEGGVRMQCVGLDLSVDQHVEIAITAARDTRVFTGRVVRIYELDDHSREYGVAFENVDDAELQFLKDHVLEE